MRNWPYLRFLIYISVVDENGLTRKERRLLKIKKKQMDRKSEGDGEPAFNIKAGHEMFTLKVS
jgi:RNA exonuclease 1